VSSANLLFVHLTITYLDHKAYNLPLLYHLIVQFLFAMVEK